jgi:RND family efflux transporter MFP subunit
VYRFLLVLALGTGYAQAAELVGRVGWSGQLDLAVPVAGVVQSVAARPGMVLKKDAVLASLDLTPFKAGVAEARADLDRLTEEESDARRDLDRVKELYARTVASTTELDAAKLRMARASSGLAAAQARIERARWQLAVAELRAPFDLLVIGRQAEPGLVVSNQCQATVLFTVVRADQWLARVELSSEQRAGLQVGNSLEVQVEGRQYQGLIQALMPRADGQWGMEVMLANDPGLHLGKVATVRLP